MNAPYEGEQGAFGFGLGGLIVCAGLGVGVGVTAHGMGSFVAAGAAAHLLAGLPAWLALTLLAYRHRQAQAEKLETARLTALAAEGRDQLFATGGDDGDASRALVRFQRYGTSLAAVVLALLQLGLAYLLFSVFPQEEVAASLTASAFLCGAAFALLLLGRFGFALERRGLIIAGAGGRLATSGALGCFVASMALAAQVQLGLTRVDRLGHLFVLAGALLGLESLLLVVLEAYRPRRAGVVVRPPFDSRLLGLVSAPADIARSIARAVDYQFGFGISQTWFYRFLERWILPLIGFSVASFWILSALTIVHPHQAGLLRRLGKLQQEALQPGLHLHLPWPIDAVMLIDAGRLHTLKTGHAVSGGVEREDEDDDHGHHHDEPDEGEARTRETVLLWSRAHVEAEEDLVLLAHAARAGEEAPADLLAVSATLNYRVVSPRAFVDRVADPEAMLEVLAEREVTRLLCSADLDSLLRDRASASEELRQRMGERAREHALGLTVVDAAFDELHPPVEVGSAFEEVSAALERAKAAVLRAEAEALASVPLSEQEAEAIRLRAHAEARGRVVTARAGAGRFAVLRELDRISPRVFRLSRLLEELVAGAGPARKIILGRSSAITDLNLEDRVRAADTPLQGLLDDSGGGEGEDEDE
jgi:regulator of protease activity HflC (stomatin/prohibitin superfamily)